MKPYRGIIKNWKKVQYADGVTIRGEFWGNHPNLQGHGHYMETSKIVRHIQPDLVETMNSRYSLGRKENEVLD